MKSLVIAQREYLSAVRSKSFLIGIILLPVMMLSGVIAQRLTQNLVDDNTYTVAIIDRTPGQTLAPMLKQAAEQRNENDIIDTETGKQTKPRFVVEIVEPSEDVDQQRLELSDRVRNKELLGFAEIGADLLKPRVDASAMPGTGQMPEMNGNMLQTLDRLESGEGVPESLLVLYRTNRPTFTQFKSFIQQTLQTRVYIARLTTLNIPLDVMTQLIPPRVVDRGLASALPDGSVSLETDSAGMVRTMIVPLVLLGLMFVVVITGASPLTTNIIEEKQERVAELLLSSVRPFDLMMGKLLGGVGVALTLAVVYATGAIFIAQQFEVLQYINVPVLLGFLIFTIMATLIYGSLFVVAGAAVTNVKEAQALITPIMLFVAMPWFIFGQVLQYPDGMLARVGSYFPITSPMVATMRLAIPPGLAIWELLLCVACALVGTLVLLWIAGRVFRAGMLVNAKAAGVREVIKWVVKG